MSKVSDQVLNFTAPSEPEVRPRLDKFLSSQTQIVSRTRLKYLDRERQCRRRWEESNGALSSGQFGRGNSCDDTACAPRQS